MQKLLKAQCFMNEMHEYEIKSFSKTLEFNPNLPKISFSNNLSSKIKHKIYFALKSRNISSWMATTRSHTISCTRFSKE